MQGLLLEKSTQCDAGYGLDRLSFREPESLDTFLGGICYCVREKKERSRACSHDGAWTLPCGGSTVETGGSSLLSRCRLVPNHCDWTEKAARHFKMGYLVTYSVAATAHPSLWHNGKATQSNKWGLQYNKEKVKVLNMSLPFKLEKEYIYLHLN